MLAVWIDVGGAQQARRAENRDSVAMPSQRRRSGNERTWAKFAVRREAPVLDAKRRALRAMTGGMALDGATTGPLHSYRQIGTSATVGGGVITPAARCWLGVGQSVRLIRRESIEPSAVRRAGAVPITTAATVDDLGLDRLGRQEAVPILALDSAEPHDDVRRVDGEFEERGNRGRVGDAADCRNLEAAGRSEQEIVDADPNPPPLEGR
ncbi:MAG TPA: hypothetical protein VHY91_14760 [Pirellulales bacterium]|jgi:hypothetical protein|nr:hypothetical protein [Pirellulales bacterium]